MTAEHLSVAVIGAGPVGLAAAANLIERGLPVKVYEAGASIAANVRAWGHVRLFSPWEYNVDPAAGRGRSPAASARSCRRVVRRGCGGGRVREVQGEG